MTPKRSQNRHLPTQNHYLLQFPQLTSHMNFVYRPDIRCRNPRSHNPFKRLLLLLRSINKHNSVIGTFPSTRINIQHQLASNQSITLIPNLDTTSIGTHHTLHLMEHEQLTQTTSPFRFVNSGVLVGICVSSNVKC